MRPTTIMRLMAQCQQSTPVSVIREHLGWAGTLKSCGAAKDLSRGKGLILASPNRYAANVLVDMYGKCGSLDDARRTFDANVYSRNIILGAYGQNASHLEEAAVVSWSAMFTAYARKGAESRKMFDGMPQRDVGSWNAMLTSYGQNGDLELAKSTFDRMPERDIVSWNAMFQAYSQAGHFAEARSAFQMMPQQNVVSWNGMIQTFSESGDTAEARRIFTSMQQRDVVSSNAQTGHVEQARSTFERMPEGDGVSSSWNAVVFFCSLVVAIVAIIAWKNYHSPGYSLFYIGGYTNEIVLAELENGKLRKLGAFPSGSSPSIMVLHPSKNYLYAVNELENGMLVAFSVDRESGKLTKLNEVSSGGDSPAAISIDPSGRFILFANYNGRNFGTVAILQDGSLAECPESLITVEGRGPNPDRQEAPHPHQLITDPSGKFAFASDLGTDKIHQLKLNNGVLSCNPAAKEVAVPPPGAGPRHLAFLGRYAYGINELANSINQYEFNKELGTLHFLDKSWSTLDASISDKSSWTAAEVATSPDGRFLYASNRGSGGPQDSLAVFEIEASTGELTLVELKELDGSGPRHFAIDPSGEFVLVAFEKSNSVAVYERDAATGKLLSRVSSLEGITKPTYIEWL